MASIVDLSRSTTEDLFCDLDLDDLYLRQARALALAADCGYPYMVLVHTRKMSIGIDLDGSFAAYAGATRHGALAVRGGRAGKPMRNKDRWEPSK